MTSQIETILAGAWLLSLPIAWLVTVYIDGRHGTELSPTPVWLVWPVVPVALAAILVVSLFLELARRARALGMQHRDRDTEEGGRS